MQSSPTSAPQTPPHLPRLVDRFVGWKHLDHWLLDHAMRETDACAGPVVARDHLEFVVAAAVGIDYLREGEPWPATDTTMLNHVMLPGEPWPWPPPTPSPASRRWQPSNRRAVRGQPYRFGSTVD
jgi:hypothetical protein